MDSINLPNCKFLLFTNIREDTLHKIEMFIAGYYQIYERMQYFFVIACLICLFRLCIPLILLTLNSPDGTRIFISNTGHQTLTTLVLDGTVLHTFTDLEMRQPTALHVSPPGHVFVGCNDGAVIQVSSNCTRKLTTIAGSEDTRKWIRSLCYNTNTGDRVVGFPSGRTIAVIKLK